MNPRRLTGCLTLALVALLGFNSTFLEEPDPPAGGPTFRSCSLIKGAVPALTLNEPAGVTDGDLVFAFVENQGETTTMSVDWTALSCSPVENTGGACPGSAACSSFYAFYAIHAAGLSYITNDSGAHQIGLACAVEVGTFDTTTEVEQCTATKDTTGDTSIIINGGTTTVANTLIFEIHTGELPDTNTTNLCSSPSNGNLTNINEREDRSKNTGNGGSLCVWTGELATASAVGTFTATRTASVNELNISIAVRPD